MRAGTRGALCVYVPYTHSASLEFLRAVARECGVPVSLLRDMVQCVGSRLLSCHCGVVLLWPGRYAGCCARDTLPPSPKGQQPASRHTRHLLPTSRAPMQKGVPDLWSYPLSDSVDRVGSGLSIHARASPDPKTTAGQPAPVSTKAPGARDHCRAASPRVYKTSWNPRPLRATSSRVCKSSWNPRPLQGNRPPCLQKFLDLHPSRATGPRVWNRSLCPRLLKATSLRVYKSSSKAGPPGDNQSHRNPDLPV